MSSGEGHSRRRSLAFRLTLWYGGIFAATSAFAFGLVYLLMLAVVQERTDEDLREDAAEFAAFMQEGGLDRVKREMQLETLGEEAEEVFFRLWSSGGREMASTDLSTWPALDVPPDELLRLEPGADPELETLPDFQDGHDVRVVYTAPAPGLVLEMGQSLAEDEEFIGTFLTGFLITLSGVVALGAPIGWFMARHALRGIRDVTRAASEIASGTLDRRVTVRSQGDELALLAQTFNTMLDRIQALMVGMREMTDNLAHDLRSPLARIRASAEMTLANGSGSANYEASACSTIEECDRLLDMINASLDIAEAESGAARLNMADIDLTALVDDAFELFNTVAEDKHLTLATILPTTCHVRGDRQRLQRVVANLLDNALKYTSAGGRVTLRLVDEPPQVRLSIEDTGVGIPPESMPRIFERFYRCDPSRSENGNGLGLSMALAFARAHGGDITVRSTLGEGSTFTVLLLAARDSPG